MNLIFAANSGIPLWTSYKDGSAEEPTAAREKGYAYVEMKWAQVGRGLEGKVDLLAVAQKVMDVAQGNGLEMVYFSSGTLAVLTNVHGVAIALHHVQPHALAIKISARCALGRAGEAGEAFTCFYKELERKLKE